MIRSASARARLNRHKPLRHAIGIVLTLAIISYLVWRLTIFSPDHLIFSAIFYLAEFTILTITLSSIYTLWNLGDRKLPEPFPDQSVDILLPVYSEPIEMLRVTAMAAKAVRYPHETFVLDDGKRDEIRDLCEELDIHYIRREINDHAKAGNLNNALKQSKADFFLVYDADHIPQVESLEIMIRYMRDDQVALVQTPQEYYNTDSLEHAPPKKGKELWHQQTLFYKLLLPGRDRLDVSSGIGSSALYRRSCIDQIGGVPTETVIEDYHTSMKFHKRGWKSVYINDAVSFGLAAHDYEEYQRTRHRWAHGNYQTLNVEQCLTTPKLTWHQKLWGCPS